MSQLWTLLTDRRGVAAALFALMLPPMLLATGAAVDFSRIGMMKTALQSVADGAALAGAGALCLSNGQQDATTAATAYFNKEAVPIQRYAQVSLQSASPVSTIKVTVTASATLSNPIMGALSTLFSHVGINEAVNVTSSAEGPAYQLQVTQTGGFKSEAWDGDSIYFYNASSGTIPSSVSSMTLLFTNDPNVDPNWAQDNNNAKTISIGANDVVGFSLVNKTGGKTSYHPNAYGAGQGSIQMFYSTLPVPSQNAYSSQPAYYTGQGTSGNCGFRYCGTYYGYGVGNEPGCKYETAITSTNTSALENSDAGADTSKGYPIWTCGSHPCTATVGKTVLQNNLLINGSCSTQATASLTCLQLQQNPAAFSWGDMGGGVDDYDHDDAVYTVSCQPSGDVTQPNSVVLVQ